MLIGIAGRARSGKTTAAEAIAHHARVSNFDSKIYDIGGMVLAHCKKAGFIPEELSREELSREQLEILVRVGMEKRKRDPNYWIEQIRNDYSAKVAENPAFVGLIPNLRYLNEVAMVQSLGGRIVKVEALNPDGSPYISPDRDPNHPSETELLNLAADYNIIAQRGHPRIVAEFAGVIFYQEVRRV